MSQINDALKRAKQSQKPQMESPPAAPPLPPLPPPRSSTPGSSGWVFLVILLIAMACFFIGLAVATRKPVTTAGNTITVTNVVQVTAPAPVIKTLPTNDVVVAAPVPTPPPAPQLKLEGIFYNATTPQAIVNGQTVYVGDSVNGFRVKTISQSNVALVGADGTEKTLALNK